MSQRGLRILLVVGKSRIFGGARDMACEMIERIVQSPHKIAAIVAEENDPVLREAENRNIATLPLPDALRGTQTQIKEAVKRGELVEWLEKLRQFNIDCGISFYSGYIPLPLIKLPASGFFLNIHPSPLPLFSGYEAEKFHVLKDRRKSCGTIHQLDEGFDTGIILARGDVVELPENMLASDVYELLMAGCFTPLINLLDKIAAEISQEKIAADLRDDNLLGNLPAVVASRKNAFNETMIRWNEDTNRQIDCRLRAFNVVPDGLHLKAQLAGKIWTVRDVICYKEDSLGKIAGHSLKRYAPGDKIGDYGQPGWFYAASIVRTIEGIAILKLGFPCSAEEPISCSPEPMFLQRCGTPPLDINHICFG